MENVKIYMQWLETLEFRRFLEIVGGNAFEMHGKYVSEMLKDEVYRFTPRTPIFLKAPTGAGKTTWIEGFINENKDAKILLLCNRVALNRQIKARIIKLLGREELFEEYTEKGLDKLKHIGNISVMTYHQFYHLDLTECDYSYCFADEVHMLYVDSSYVPYTDKILKKLVGMRNVVRIYISATPENIFPILLDYEYSMVSNLSKGIAFQNNERPICSVYYELITREKHFENVYFFNDYEDIVPLISNNKGQTIVFVDRIVEGKKIKELLQNKISTEFITSESKNEGEGYLEYKKICSNESFDSNTIICTKTLTEGVNIKMKQLNQVVLTVLEYETFVQSLGRRREIRDSNKVTVFVKMMSKSEINQKLHECKANLHYLYMIEHLRGYELDRFINEGKNVEYANLCFLENGRFHVNKIAKKYLKQMICLYEMMLKDYDINPYVSAILALHWLFPEKTELTLDENSIIRPFSEFSKGREELMNLLEKNVGKVMTKEEREVFFNNFKIVYLKSMGQSDKSVRKDRNFGRTVINKILDKLSCPYKITLNNGRAIVERIGE